MSSGARTQAEPGRALFSIVVAVHDVAHYLAECLESVLTQPGPDLELIAVDDASSDHGGALLDSYADADPRVRVIHLSTNVGLGQARNTGIELAAAPYLLFLDGDDALAPGALAAIAERILATASPDVVMFGFARSYPDGRLEPDERSRALAPRAAITAEARPALLDILPVAWNKAYRRDYLTRWGLRFGPGIYEDLPWTYPVLMTAAPIATLELVGYHYRQRGSGNILSSTGRRHLEIFAQYDAVFAFIDAHPEFASWRVRLFDRLSRHIPTVLETDRIPAAVRRDFFHAASQSFRQHRPPGYLPAGSAGLKIRLIERGDYRAFRVAQLGNRAHRWATRRWGNS